MTSPKNNQDPQVITASIVLKAMEKIAIVSWMSAEHEDRTLQCHNLEGQDSLAYHMVRSANPIEQVSRLLQTPLITLEERENIENSLVPYLLSYANKIDKRNWLVLEEGGSSTALLLNNPNKS